MKGKYRTGKQYKTVHQARGSGRSGIAGKQERFHQPIKSGKHARGVK